MNRSNLRPHAAPDVQPDHRSGNCPDRDPNIRHSVRSGIQPCIRRSIRFSVLAVLCAVLAVSWTREARAVPLDDIHLAQGAVFVFDTTMTVKQAMDNYSYFSKVVWSVNYDINNRKVVEARGYFDMAKIAMRTDAGTCVDSKGNSVGLTDTTPFLMLQFKTDFLKQKAAVTSCALWGLHGDARLDDTDLLWAKALITNELPSPAPLCAMPLSELSPADNLAIQEAPVVDPGAADTGPPRQAPASAPTPAPPAKSAAEATKKSHESPPTPTQTGR